MARSAMRKTRHEDDPHDLTVPLVDAANGSGFGEAVLSVCCATNVLSPLEKRLRDWIDVQCFIWVVGDYKASTKAPAMMPVGDAGPESSSNRKKILQCLIRKIT